MGACLQREASGWRTSTTKMRLTVKVFGTIQRGLVYRGLAVDYGPAETSNMRRHKCNPSALWRRGQATLEAAPWVQISPVHPWCQWPPGLNSCQYIFYGRHSSLWFPAFERRSSIFPHVFPSFGGSLQEGRRGVEKSMFTQTKGRHYKRKVREEVTARKVPVRFCLSFSPDHWGCVPVSVENTSPRVTKHESQKWNHR